ncbi:MAG: FAD synthetase family protein [Bacteroidales bacterium]
MRVFNGFTEATGIRNPVVTTGSFDGVHIGHKTILNRLKSLAGKIDGESVLITFHPHPRKVLYPETAGKDLKLINTQEEKLHLLEKAGLDNIIVVEFTRDFARTRSEEFVRDYLTGILGARIIVVGFNHHFGFNQEGDYRQLWEMRAKYNFEAEEIPEQEVQHETVSSTRIRKAISEGYIQRANAYLDHYYIVIGEPLNHEKVSDITGLNFSIVPLVEDTKLIPPPGVYATSFEKGSVKGKAILLINKDFSNEPAVYLSCNEMAIEDGEKIKIEFQKRITGNINLNDKHSSRSRINAAAAEISELIF